MKCSCGFGLPRSIERAEYRCSLHPVTIVACTLRSTAATLKHSVEGRSRTAAVESTARGVCTLPLAQCCRKRPQRQWQRGMTRAFLTPWRPRRGSSVTRCYTSRLNIGNHAASRSTLQCVCCTKRRSRRLFGCQHPAQLPGFGQSDHSREVLGGTRQGKWPVHCKDGGLVNLPEVDLCRR